MLKKMNNQRDYREQQQNMNQCTGYVEDQEATQPREQQNCKQNDEHVSLLVPEDGLILLGLGFLT
jgi:hypothetical protein